jgi:hypothetical protein
LIANGSEIKKMHNIEYLLSECAEFDKDFVDIDPKELSDFGVDVRYSDDIFIPDKAETLEYKNLALRLRILLRIRLIRSWNRINH